MCCTNSVVTVVSTLMQPMTDQARNLKSTSESCNHVFDTPTPVQLGTRLHANLLALNSNKEEMLSQTNTSQTHGYTAMPEFVRAREHKYYPTHKNACRTSDCVRCMLCCSTITPGTFGIMHKLIPHPAVKYTSLRVKASYFFRTDTCKTNHILTCS